MYNINPLFLSIGKQIHFDCSDVSRILPESNMSGLGLRVQTKTYVQMI